MRAGVVAVPLQAEAPAQPSPFGFLFPMVVIFLIFYLLLIRPQQRRQREHEHMLAALQKGDRVVTAGGLHGNVVGLADDVVTLEIANLRGDRVRVKVDRARVERRIEAAKGGEEK